MKEATDQKQFLTTSKFSEIFGVKPDTVRRNLCVKGHFLGIKPLKLPNNRLLWPAITPDQLEG